MPSTKREDFVESVRSLIGTPWVHQGRSRAGVDCLGLPIVAAKEIGIAVPDESVYGRFNDPQHFLRNLKKYLVKISRKDIQPGDIVWLNFQNREATHLGVVAEKNGRRTVIHCPMTGKSVVEVSLRDNMFHSAYRWHEWHN